MNSNAFKAQDIGLRTQKKLLSKMAGNKTVVKTFIDDTTASILDNLYKLVKLHYPNKKDSEKIIKHIIKIIIKIGILYKNNQFNNEELKLIEQFKQKFLAVQMTVISFHEVDFSYDRTYLIEILKETYVLLVKCVNNHLTEKTMNKIANVFNFFTNEQLLDSVFQSSHSSEYRHVLKSLVDDLNKTIDF